MLLASPLLSRAIWWRMHAVFAPRTAKRDDPSACELRRIHYGGVRDRDHGGVQSDLVEIATDISRRICPAGPSMAYFLRDRLARSWGRWSPRITPPLRATAQGSDANARHANMSCAESTASQSTTVAEPKMHDANDDHHAAAAASEQHHSAAHRHLEAGHHHDTVRQTGTDKRCSGGRNRTAQTSISR